MDTYLIEGQCLPLYASLLFHHVIVFHFFPWTHKALQLLSESGPVCFQLYPATTPNLLTESAGSLHEHNGLNTGAVDSIKDFMENGTSSMKLHELHSHQLLNEFHPVKVIDAELQATIKFFALFYYTCLLFTLISIFFRTYISHPFKSKSKVWNGWSCFNKTNWHRVRDFNYSRSAMLLFFYNTFLQPECRMFAFQREPRNYH